ncbi:MAG TPA: glycosyltransferase family 2 protein [Solirubrobacteraceae bacterium]|nr:glycosyltransferase family 2 protein [Solirubrobacteraceae bacterium]
MTQATATANRIERPATLEALATTVSVVIPTLNEAANLPHVLARIPACVSEVVLVDGHSTDGTIEVARAMRPDIRVVLQEGRGKGNALACGFAAATGEIIVTLDADGSADPAEIDAFLALLRDGHDFVKGSRFLAGGGSDDITAIRRAGNRALLAVLNLLYGRRYTDLCYGFNAFWRHCLAHMRVDCDGFEVETLITARVSRAGLRVAEVASVEHSRLHGVSNLRAPRDGIRVLATILRERLRRDIRPADHGVWAPEVRELPHARSAHRRGLAVVRPAQAAWQQSAGPSL